MSKKRGFLGNDPDSTSGTEPEAPSEAKTSPLVEVKLSEAGSTLPPSAPPPAPIQVVALDVYCRVSGRKLDQTKAFAGWAKRQGLRALPMDEWKQKWDEFQNRPV